MWWIFFEISMRIFYNYIVYICRLVKDAVGGPVSEYMASHDHMTMNNEVEGCRKKRWLHKLKCYTGTSLDVLRTITKRPLPNWSVLERGKFPLGVSNVTMWADFFGNYSQYRKIGPLELFSRFAIGHPIKLCVNKSHLLRRQLHGSLPWRIPSLLVFRDPHTIYPRKVESLRQGIWPPTSPANRRSERKVLSVVYWEPDEADMIE